MKTIKNIIHVILGFITLWKKDKHRLLISRGRHHDQTTQLAIHLDLKHW